MKHNLYVWITSMKLDDNYMVDNIQTFQCNRNFMMKLILYLKSPTEIGHSSTNLSCSTFFK